MVEAKVHQLDFSLERISLSLKEITVFYHEYKFSNFSLITVLGVRFKGKPQKNEKLRNTLVTVHLDGMHMCIQVIL